MKPTKSLWTRIALVGILTLPAVFALTAWSRHDYCRGWSDHYVHQAARLRAAAQDLRLTPDERRERLIAAEWQDVISGKYAATARRPWRPYPGHPLVTPEEQRMAAAKYLPQRPQ
jgi:hypothetical protein